MMNSRSLELNEVIQMIEHALEKKQPFSLVRIGDGENLILSQNTVLRLQNILMEPWAIKANNGQKGVKLPNYSLRNSMIESIKKANVVGILPQHDSTIQAPSHLKRVLTDKIFSYHKIVPTYTCHACINRELVLEQEFWKILKKRRILIIYQFADQLKNILQSEPYHLNITMMIPFAHYNQMTKTLGEIKKNKDKFDVALICCGVNAVVLAHKVAELSGKVGIDFGKASNILIKGRPN